MSRGLQRLGMRPWLALGAAFGLSWAGGAALASPSTIASAVAAAGITTIAAGAHGDSAERSCEGGVTAPVDIAIAPTRSVAQKGGEALVLDVALINKLGRAASARYGVEIVTDTGAPVKAATRS